MTWGLGVQQRCFPPPHFEAVSFACVGHRKQGRFGCVELRLSQKEKPRGAVRRTYFMCRLVGPGFDLLDAALLDLCLEYILPKVPLKALACLTLASGQAHALVLRAISVAVFWKARLAIYDCITAARPTSKGELHRILEKASEVPSECEARQLSCLLKALVSQLAPPQIIEMVQTLRPFRILTHLASGGRHAQTTGLVSLGHRLQLCADSRHRAAWTADLVLQLARGLDLTETYELVEFASYSFGAVSPADVARLLAADLQPSERPAFYVTALSFDGSASPAIEPLVALAQGEPLQFVFDTITAFAAADEQESQDQFYEAEHAECFAAGFVEAWAREVAFPHSWSVPDRLAMAHAVTSCNEVAKKGLGRIVLRWLPSIVNVPMRPPTDPRGLLYFRPER